MPYSPVVRVADELAVSWGANSVNPVKSSVFSVSRPCAASSLPQLAKEIAARIGSAKK